MKAAVKTLVAAAILLALAVALGLGSLAASASTYHSVGVASYAKAGDRTLSWGAFGMVFVAD